MSRHRDDYGKTILGLAGLVAASWAGSAAGKPTAMLEIDSFQDLDKGKPLGTLVSSRGEVLPGMGVERLKTPETVMLWSHTRAKDGTVYFGTADQGKILSVRGGTVRVVATLDTVLVTALTMGPDGKLLAGTMPDARILEVDPKKGKWRQIAKLPAEHVWALAYDAKARTVYAASGGPGKVFSLPAAGGKPKVYFDPKERHLLCLLRDSRGRLLTGGSDKAILYRVSGPNRALALHDFDATELQALAETPGGDLYIAVNRFPRKESGVPRFDRPEKGKEGTRFKVVNKNKNKKKLKVKPGDLRPGAKTGKGALYRLDSTGRLDELLTLSGGYFTDVGVDPQGTVWAGDGAKGKVYQVKGERSVATAFDLKERQALTLAVEGTTRYIGTGDSGVVYRIKPRPDETPSYESKVLDAQYPASWGALELQATGKLRVSSRSGNTAKPDATWNAWVAARGRPGPRVGIASPAARYLQIKTTWPKADAAVLRSFQLYYRPQNQRATLKEITFDREDKKAPRKSKIKISWKTDNADKDQLVYRVSYRDEMGVTWQRMGGDKPLDKTTYEWDTEGIADGRYRVKVVLSDEQANGPNQTLTHELVSKSLLVDNRKPDVVGLKVRHPWATGLARDGYSPLVKIEYTVDGGSWRLVEPIDGIYDSPAESFRIVLPARLGRGPHVLAVKVSDAAGNVGVRQVRFRR